MSSFPNAVFITWTSSLPGCHLCAAVSLPGEMMISLLCLAGTGLILSVAAVESLTLAAFMAISAYVGGLYGFSASPEPFL